MDQPTRTCRDCGAVKPLADFPRVKAGVYRRQCKKCRSEYEREWRAGKADHLRAYREANPVRRDPDYFRQYRVANREAVLSNEARYRAANRHKEAARRHARRSLPVDDQAREWMSIIRADPCSYCGLPGGTVDHIVPISAGGTNEWQNLTGACLSCNSQKRTRGLLRFLMRRA